MTIQAVKEIKKVLNHSSDKTVNVYVHPDVAERLQRQVQHSIRELERSTRSRIFVVADPSLHREDTNITFVK